MAYPSASRKEDIIARSYRVIDADGHGLEPIDLWDRYMDPKYRDRGPQLFIDHDGKERLRVEDQVIGGPKGLGHRGAIGARHGGIPEHMRYVERRLGGFDLPLSQPLAGDAADCPGYLACSRASYLPGMGQQLA
jgi:hypothetical protein